VRTVIGYALLVISGLCLILMLTLWLYMIWTPGYDDRILQSQGFILVVMCLTGFAGGMMLSFK